MFAKIFALFLMFSFLFFFAGLFTKRISPNNKFFNDIYNIGLIGIILTFIFPISICIFLQAIWIIFALLNSILDNII